MGGDDLWEERASPEARQDYGTSFCTARAITCDPRRARTWSAGSSSIEGGCYQKPQNAICGTLAAGSAGGGSGASEGRHEFRRAAGRGQAAGPEYHGRQLSEE